MSFIFSRLYSLTLQQLKPYVFPVIWYALGVFIKTKELSKRIIKYITIKPTPIVNYILYNIKTQNTLLYSKECIDIVDSLVDNDSRKYISIHLDGNQYLIESVEKGNTSNQSIEKYTNPNVFLPKRFLSASLTFTIEETNDEEHVDLTDILNRYIGNVDVEFIRFIIAHILKLDSITDFKFEAITPSIENIIITTSQTS
jgi:hypothetical protein